MQAGGIDTSIEEDMESMSLEVLEDIMKEGNMSPNTQDGRSQTPFNLDINRKSIISGKMATP